MVWGKAGKGARQLSCCSVAAGGRLLIELQTRSKFLADADVVSAAFEKDKTSLRHLDSNLVLRGADGSSRWARASRPGTPPNPPCLN